jgi:hypothetical protein
MRQFVLTYLLASSAICVSASTVITVTVEPSSSVSPNNRNAVWRWTFESANGSDPRTGQYACGSFWVAPASGDTAVRLLSITGSGTPGDNDLITLDDDPLPYSHGLLCLGTRTYASNDAAKNDLPDLPIVYTPASGSAISLVSGMQRNEDETSNGGTSAIVGGVMDAYCIVTVVHSPPPDNGVNSIRPNFVGDTKEFLTWSDFDLDRLPRLSFLGAKTAPQIETIRERWAHSTEVFSMKGYDGAAFATYSEGGRAFRAHILHHNYAGGRAQAFSTDFIGLMGTNDLADIKPALAAIIAGGLDQYHFMYGRSGYPGAWSSGAGQWGGQFTGPCIAATLLIDGTKAARLKKVAADNYSSDPNQRGPQEFRQIIRGLSGVMLWGDSHDPVAAASSTLVQDLHNRYWADFKGGACYTGAIGTCNLTVGKKTTADPHRYIDGPPNAPGSNYMGVSAGNAKALAAIAAMWPEFRAVMNNDALVEYADRINQVGVWALPDPVAPIPVYDQVSECSPWTGGAGCDDYRVVWGPTVADVRKAVENGVGRFAAYHGDNVNVGYPVTVVESNWATIMALYDGSTYDDWLTDIDECVPPDIIIYPEGSGQVAYMRGATWDSTIHYETGASEATTATPTTGSAVYSAPVAIGNGVFVKAIAVASGKTASRVSLSAGTPAAASAPAAPSTVTLAQVGSAGWRLEWADVLNESNYRIQWRIGAGSWTEVFVASDLTAYAFASGTPLTNYEVQIRAENPSGVSSYSAATPTSVTTAGLAPVSQPSQASRAVLLAR